MLRRTLVLQQFYSSLLALPSFSLSEGEGAVLQNFNQLFVLPHRQRISILHLSASAIFFIRFK